MLSSTEKNECIIVKSTFEKTYRISASVLAPMMDRMVFAGGVFTSLHLGQKPHDVDLFILNASTTDYEKINSYLTNNIWVIHKKIKKNSTYIDVNPRILGVWKTTSIVDIKYDIIFTDYISPEEVINDFDYEHSKVWYHNGKMNFRENTYNSIKSMKLVPSPGKIPTKERKDKFLNRGWSE